MLPRLYMSAYILAPKKGQSAIAFHVLHYLKQLYAYAGICDTAHSVGTENAADYGEKFRFAVRQLLAQDTYAEQAAAFQIHPSTFNIEVVKRYVYTAGYSITFLPFHTAMITETPHFREAFHSADNH